MRRACAVGLAAEIAAGSSYARLWQGAVGEPSVSAGFCNRRRRMNAISGVGACVLSVRCQLRREHPHNRSLRLSKPCKSALQWSHEPDTIIKAERTPFQAEQMPLVCRGALGRLRPLAVDLDEQSRGRTRTTKPNEHQANEHPPFVRAPGTSSIVRCSRTRRTTLRAGPSTSQDLSQGLEALGTL